MGYQIISPPANLEQYVRCFWVMEHDKPYAHHAIADGLAEMVFHYDGSFGEMKDGREVSSWRSGVQAQSQRSRHFVAHTRFGIFGVYLYPYTLPLLFNAPANIFSNEIPDLQDLIGSHGVTLEEQMILAEDTQQRVQIICSFLRRRLQQNERKIHPIHNAVKTIIDRNGQVSVRDVAHDYGLSLRQFERLFKASAGFSPKLYTRIIRFSSAVRRYKSEETFTSLAYASGYYDQSHFIEDFKVFTGMNPRTYFLQTER